MGTLASLDLCQRPLTLTIMSKDNSKYRQQHGVKVKVTDLISPETKETPSSPAKTRTTQVMTYNPFDTKFFNDHFKPNHR